MSGREVDTYGIGNTDVSATTVRKAVTSIADRVAAENPHALDDTMPKLAGRLIGQDPVAAVGLLELLAALGLPTTRKQLRAVEARARVERADDLNRQLKGEVS